jgi:ABC-type glycerol-3-phosphate transport system permease component
MNCLYITLFFNIVAGIVQTFIKSWNQLLYPRVVKSDACPLKHVMTSCTSVTVAWIQERGEKPMFHLQSQWSPEKHLLPVRSK